MILEALEEVRLSKKISKNILKFSLILLLSLSVTSCYGKYRDYLPNRPINAFDEDLKEASVDFGRGWKDGCETGMAGGSNTFYQIFYRNNAVDGYKMTGSPDYKSGWGNGFWYCYRHDYIKQKSGIWGSMFGGYQ